MAQAPPQGPGSPGLPGSSPGASPGSAGQSVQGLFPKLLPDPSTPSSPTLDGAVALPPLDTSPIPDVPSGEPALKPSPSGPAIESPPALPTVIAELVNSKHEEYNAKARRYSVLYYATRLGAGFSAGFVPFVISSHTDVATGLSLVVVVCTVLDMVFSPKERWALFSKASDLLGVAELKFLGSYEKYKDFLDVILGTERGKLERLTDVEELVKKLQSQPGKKEP